MKKNAAAIQAVKVRSKGKTALTVALFQQSLPRRIDLLSLQDTHVKCVTP
jgi:hypothetical protein